MTIILAWLDFVISILNPEHGSLAGRSIRFVVLVNAFVNLE